MGELIEVTGARYYVGPTERSMDRTHAFTHADGSMTKAAVTDEVTGVHHRLSWMDQVIPPAQGAGAGNVSVHARTHYVGKYQSCMYISPSLVAGTIDESAELAANHVSLSTGGRQAEADTMSLGWHLRNGGACDPPLSLLDQCYGLFPYNPYFRNHA